MVELQRLEALGGDFAFSSLDKSRAYVFALDMCTGKRPISNIQPLLFWF